MKTRRETLCRVRPRLRSVLAAMCAGGALLAAGSARALDNDRWTVFADEMLTWDSNVLRLPSGQSPSFGNGSGPRSDWHATTALGVAFDIPVSRQRFQGGFTWNDTRFDRYKELDFTGHEGRLLWLWELGNSATGKVGYTDVTAPQTFANVQGRANDVLRTRQLFANGSVFVASRLRLDAGANGYEQRAENEASRRDDIDITTLEGAANYVSTTDRTAGLHVRGEDGRYPERDNLSNSAFPRSYRQYDTGAVFDWRLTPKSKFSGHLDYATRRWEQFGERNWDGVVGKLQYDWQPTGKLFVTSFVRREVNPYEDARSNFTVIKSVTIIPTWNATSKVDISAAFDYSVRDYPSVAQFACGLAAGNSDRVKSATLSAVWRAARLVTVRASAQHQSCSSDFAGGNYVANILSLGVRIAL